MELIVSAHCSKIQKALTEMQKLLYCFLTLDATKHSLAVAARGNPAGAVAARGNSAGDFNYEKRIICMYKT